MLVHQCVIYACEQNEVIFSGDVNWSHNLFWVRQRGRYIARNFRFDFVVKRNYFGMQIDLFKLALEPKVGIIRTKSYRNKKSLLDIRLHCLFLLSVDNFY